MAQIHRKKSLIKKRQATGSPKDKKAFEAKQKKEKMKSALSGFVSTTISGMKMIGGRLAEGASEVNSKKSRTKMNKLANKLSAFGQRSGKVFGGDMGFGRKPKKRRR